MNPNNDISEVLLPQSSKHDTLLSITSSQDPTSRVTSAENIQKGPVSEKQDLDVDQATLTLGFDQLSIHRPPPMAERMFLSLGVIFQDAAEELDLVSTPIVLFL